VQCRQRGRSRADQDAKNPPREQLEVNAVFPDGKVAYLKDPEGNVMALGTAL